MRYLIDGYNLMYALGLVRKDGGRAGWDRARRQLLDWLAEHLGTSAADATIALDAQSARPAPVIAETYRGLNVIRRPSRAADDLIEDLVRNERSPEMLTVVSNDARVREAGKRRGCLVQRCEEFVESLINPTRASTVEPRTDDEKAVQPTAQEKVDWLRAFGG
jgi:predicted RNA-binding protein with PIN domain